MKCFFVISVLFSTVVIIAALPANGIVEIERQRLIKFPEETFQYQTSKQSDETRRILEEINKININLGYVKKQEPQQTVKMPTILDSEQYLYPRPAYHPGLHGVAVPPSIRNLRYNHPLNGVQYNSYQMYSPAHQYSRGNQLDHPKRYLKVPTIQPPKKFREHFDGEFALEEPELNQEPSKAQKLNNMYKIHLVGDIRQFIKAFQLNQNKINKANGKTALPLIFLPAKLQSYDQVQNDLEARKSNNDSKAEKQRLNTKLKEIKNPAHKKIVQSSNSISPIQEQRFKTPFGIFNKPATQIATTTKPIANQPNENYVKTSTLKEKVPDYYDSVEESIENTEGNEKTLLSAFNKDNPSTIKHGVKDGGIIIQRLKVRKGGIAIAGPGGVATAGSGGTAIVGPGGFALTHPRSLTIAGPGAKVIAYPETFNLREAALRTSINNIPEGGKIVATGPTIYYNPAESEFYQTRYGVVPERAGTTVQDLPQKPLDNKRKNAPESTTESLTTIRTPEKLQNSLDKPITKDIQYLTAIQQPNNKFIVEKIIPVPGTRIFQITTLERNNIKSEKLSQVKSQKIQFKEKKPSKIISLSQNLLPQLEDMNIEDTTVKIEVTGHTGADQPSTAGDIPVDAYFSPYFGNTIFSNGPSLILEPQAKAIAGNGGIAVSAPISRAILKKGVNTRVYFRPQSVAIAGAGGTAHAQADLILDYVN